MPRIAKLASGETIEFPDGTSDADMDAEVRARLAAPKPEGEDAAEMKQEQQENMALADIADAISDLTDATLAASQKSTQAADAAEQAMKVLLDYVQSRNQVESKMIDALMTSIKGVNSTMASVISELRALRTAKKVVKLNDDGTMGTLELAGGNEFSGVRPRG